MIHTLIADIITLFEAQLSRTAFSAGPLPEAYFDLPAIAVTAGALTTLQSEANQPLQPRRVPVAQRINITAASRGPFPLDHSPYKGSLSATITTRDQSTFQLIEPVHFAVERAARKLTFTDATPEVGSVLVTYDYSGLALVQEFEQALLVEVRATEIAQAERLAAIAAAIILTSSEELARRASETVAQPHAGLFRAANVIQGIALKSAAPGSSRYLLTFTVRGQLKLIKELA